jgi:hypothetical protein
MTSPEDLVATWVEAYIACEGGNVVTALSGDRCRTRATEVAAVYIVSW